MEIKKKLQELFVKHFNESPLTITALPASGSDRKYFRLKGASRTAIGVYNPDRNENGTFIYFTQLFSKGKLPVPELYETSSNKETYLIQDLGEETLFDILIKEGFTERVKTLFRKSIDGLVKFHWEAGRKVDYTMCYAARAFDRQQILLDLLYFKYYFVDPLKIQYDRMELLNELETWSRSLAAMQPRTFMYRDFQSRNIQVIQDDVFFIDYQGGMQGLPQYDLASLLWQARAQLPEDWKNEMLNYYFTALQSLESIPSFHETDFRKGYLECVLLRMLQTLGAYGFRGLIEGKSHFIQSISPALHQLAYFLDQYPNLPAYNEIGKVLHQLVKPEILARFKPAVLANENSPLKVQIYSFSYKKGIPADASPHGGGFVFDCRGILNPGRQEEYKSLTGKDPEVKYFLEQQTKMPEFLEGVYQTVDIAVADYLHRNFDHLSIAFGCTGGQHRSVYAAESLALHLKEKFGVATTLRHLEQEENDVKRLQLS